MNAIVGGKIIQKDRILEGYALLFSDIIEGIVPQESVPSDVNILNAHGGFVSPGLIDLHIHGYLGKDVCDGEEESIRTIARGLLENGVTGFLPTTMTVDMKTIRKALKVCRNLKEESASWEGSEILGVHAEGPFISKEYKGAQNEDFILKPDPLFVKEFADIIKILTLAPETDREDFSAIRKIAGETDVVISMGHTATDYETAMKGIGAGVRHATHLFNAMSPLRHVEPGAVGAALTSDISAELIVDMCHVKNVLYDMLWKLKGRKLCFITDCLPAGGLPYGNYTLGGAQIVYKDGICRLLNGTVAGSALRLNQGVWNVYQHSSIPLYECVNCASLNPATVIGLDQSKGSIDVGKDADILITDDSFQVKKTFIRGKERFSTDN